MQKSGPYLRGMFGETIEQMRSQVPAVTIWLWVNDVGGVCPDWATPYEDVATGTQAVKQDWDRDGDELCCSHRWYHRSA